MCTLKEPGATHSKYVTQLETSMPQKITLQTIKMRNFNFMIS